MLLLMPALGVGLTVFRWPWEETVVVPDFRGDQTIVTTYRRGWWGKKQRNGLRSRFIGGHRESEFLYVDDNLRRERWFNWEGK